MESQEHSALPASDALRSALLDTESKFRSIFEVITDAILILDRFGIIAEANPVACNLFGVPHPSFVGMPIAKLFSPAEENTLDSFLDRVRHGEYSRDNFLCCNAMGNTFPTEVRATPCFLRKQMYIYLAIQDITEQRRAETQQQELLRILETKNEELENVVYVTSHDLRSPLINIKGFGKELENVIEAIRTRIKGRVVDPELHAMLDNEFPTCLGFIGKSIERMDQLLNSLLYLSRIGRLPCEPRILDMGALLQQIIGGMQYQILQTVSVIEVEPLTPCYADATHIGQVFSNLLDNAIKYRNPTRPCQIRVSCQSSSAAEIIYAVQDNGMGIPSQHFSRIFAMFHRLHPRDAEGEGIGLPAALRLLQRNNGRVWVESVEGAGSTFWVALPTAPAK